MVLARVGSMLGLELSHLSEGLLSVASETTVGLNTFQAVEPWHP